MRSIAGDGLAYPGDVVGDASEDSRDSRGSGGACEGRDADLDPLDTVVTDQRAAAVTLRHRKADWFSTLGGVKHLNKKRLLPFNLWRVKEYICSLPPRRRLDTSWINFQPGRGERSSGWLLRVFLHTAACKVYHL